MSSYFKNTRAVPYKFGTSSEVTLHQDLSAYVDIVDQIRDNMNFYRKYHIIDGERPDTLSYKLYGTTKYYWTFFMMNDSIREGGWPLTNQELIAYIQLERNNAVLTTRDEIFDKFFVGSTVTGLSSAATGKIIERRLDMGQIIVAGANNFVSGEVITTTEDEVLQSIQIVGAADEKDAVYQYESEEGVRADFDVYTGPGALLSAVSFSDFYTRQNNANKDIVVLKKDVIARVFQDFQSGMKKRNG